MREKIFDESDYFRSESDGEATRNASPRRSVSTRKKGENRTFESERKCVETLIARAQPSEQPTLRRSERSPEAIDDTRASAQRQIAEKLRETGKRFLLRMRRPNAIQRVDLSLSEQLEAFQRFEKRGADVEQRFVSFLLSQGLPVRLIYFLELDGYFPRRFNLNARRPRGAELSAEPRAALGAVEKALNDAGVCLQVVDARGVQQLSGNTPMHVWRRLNRRPVIGAFALTFGARSAVRVAEVSPLFLPEHFWPQVALNQRYLRVEEALGELLTEDGMTEEEKAERARKVAERIPQSVYEFKVHPTLTVAAALRRNEVLRAGAEPTGQLFLDRPVYLKADVLTLQGKTRWRMVGRRVRDGEEPLKLVEMGVGERAVGLYAEHQTEPFAPRVIDGRLPVNEYGNVEVFHEVPEGCAHLKMKGVWRAAKMLGVEYSHAAVGFERRRGRNFAVKEGIVVHKKDVKAIQKRYKRMLAEIEKKEIEKQLKESLTQWRKLFKVLLVKKYINKNYY